MKPEKGWPVLSVEPLVETKLPPRPRIKRIMADVCPDCGVVHFNAASKLACVETRSQL